MTNTETQHNTTIKITKTQHQSLIDTTITSINLIQLKLQTKQKLIQTKTTRLNIILNYIDTITTTNTNTTPNII